MRFTETAVAGVYTVAIEPITDERGFFARTWCAREFETHGLAPCVAQCSISLSLKRGTLRGMHYQLRPYAEAKLVRCTRGAMYDVAVDLRPDSPTFCKWVAAELTADNHLAMYLPPGCAHGFQTLAPDTGSFYQISQPYVEGLATGVRWDDPAFAIAWPDAERTISTRDASWPEFDPAAAATFT